MQEVETESGPNPRLTRQQSLSAIKPSRCGMGCMGGGRRGKSLADFEFEALFRDCRGFFSGGHRAITESSVGGSGNADNNGYNSTIKDTEGNNNDDHYYKAPSHWQVLCRKLRAEARRNMQRRTAIRPFRYDSLSYAMNFDDGNRMQQEQDEAGIPQLRYLSKRFSGPVGYE